MSIECPLARDDHDERPFMFVCVTPLPCPTMDFLDVLEGETTFASLLAQLAADQDTLGPAEEDRHRQTVWRSDRTDYLEASQLTYQALCTKFHEEVAPAWAWDQFRTTRAAQQVFEALDVRANTTSNDAIHLALLQRSGRLTSLWRVQCVQSHEDPQYEALAFWSHILPHTKKMKLYLRSPFFFASLAFTVLFYVAQGIDLLFYDGVETADSDDDDDEEFSDDDLQPSQHLWWQHLSVFQLNETWTRSRDRDAGEAWWGLRARMRYQYGRKVNDMTDDERDTHRVAVLFRTQHLARGMNQAVNRLFQFPVLLETRYFVTLMPATRPAVTGAQWAALYKDAKTTSDYTERMRRFLLQEATCKVLNTHEWWILKNTILPTIFAEECPQQPFMQFRFLEKYDTSFKEHLKHAVIPTWVQARIEAVMKREEARTGPAVHVAVTYTWIETLMFMFEIVRWMEDVANLPAFNGLYFVSDITRHWRGETCGPTMIVISPNECALVDGLDVKIATISQVFSAWYDLVMARHGGDVYMSDKEDPRHMQNIETIMIPTTHRGAYLEHTHIHALGDQTLAWADRLLDAGYDKADSDDEDEVAQATRPTARRTPASVLAGAPRI